MKKFLAVLVVTGSIFLTAPVAHASFLNWNTVKLRQSARFGNCKYQTKDGHMGFTDMEVKLTIWCAAKHFGVSAQRAFCYAGNESGFNEFAKNPNSSASGIFQVVDGTWTSWYYRYPDLRKHWRVSFNRFHPRNSALVVMKQVRSSGWGPWRNFAQYSC